MLGCVLARRGVPVIGHLQSQDEVQREAGKEAVEDQVVGDFLDGGEHTGGGAEEVGEDLCGRERGVG